MCVLYLSFVHPFCPLESWHRYFYLKLPTFFLGSDQQLYCGDSSTNAVLISCSHVVQFPVLYSESPFSFPQGQGERDGRHLLLQEGGRGGDRHALHGAPTHWGEKDLPPRTTPFPVEMSELTRLLSSSVRRFRDGEMFLCP